MVTSGFALLGIAAIAAVCQCVVPPIKHDARFDAQYTVVDGFFYAGQPAKTAAYQAGILAAPFLIAIGFWWARRWASRWSDRAIDRVINGGTVAYLLLMVSCVWPILYCPHPPFWILPPSWILLPMEYSHPFYQPERIAFLLAALGLFSFFATHPASARNANKALIAVLIVWTALVPSRFYLPSEIDDDPRYLYHLNSVLDALSQVVDGHHLLVDFPHIYGGYVEMLGPVVGLFPRTLGVLLASLAVTSVLGLLCLLLAARVVVRHPAILFLTGLTLLAVTCLAASEDVNYGYLSARLFFTPLGLLAALLYFRRPSVRLYVVTTAMAALATIWNLDTGTVLWFSWTVTLAVMATSVRDVHGCVRHLLTQAGCLASAWAAFLLYLRVVSGQWPDLKLLFYFQDFVVSSGYFCLRLLFPDMWVFILTLYVAGLAVAACAIARGHGGRWTSTILLLSVFGIGIFSYFMGRSAPSNLIAVSYPAILLAGLFCSEGASHIQSGGLPTRARFLFLPAKIALFWWAFLMVAGIPDFLLKSGHALHHWGNSETTPLRANVAFIKAQVQPREDGVFFLSNHSGIYSYLSDTARPIRIPGMIELLRARDMDALLDAIRARKFARLFVEQNFYAIEMYRPDIYQQVREAIAENYRMVAVGPGFGLVLYAPR
jgi:hypothetical protein